MQRAHTKRFCSLAQLRKAAMKVGGDPSVVARLGEAKETNFECQGVSITCLRSPPGSRSIPKITFCS